MSNDPGDSDRPLPRFPIEDDHHDHAFDPAPRVSRTSLEPTAISKPPTSVSPSASLAMPAEKEPNMPRPNSDPVVPTEPPPPPPTKAWLGPGIRLLFWGLGGLAVAGGIAWLTAAMLR